MDAMLLTTAAVVVTLAIITMTSLAMHYVVDGLFELLKMARK